MYGKKTNKNTAERGLSTDIVHTQRCQQMKNKLFTESFGNVLSHNTVQSKQVHFLPSFSYASVFGLFLSRCLFKAKLTDNSEAVTDRSLLLYENYEREVLWRCMQQNVMSLHALFS